MMEVKHLIKDKENGCPYGHKCDACNLYRPLYRTDDKGKVTQEWDCNLNNIVVLMSEQKQRTQGVQQAVESFRNNVDEANKRPMIMVDKNGKRQLRLPTDSL